MLTTQMILTAMRWGRAAATAGALRPAGRSRGGRLLSERLLGDNGARNQLHDQTASKSAVKSGILTEMVYQIME